jgi:hypothetical protein
MLPQLSQSVIPGYTEHMSEILVTRSHKLSMKKARLAAEHVAVDLEKEFDLTYAWMRMGFYASSVPVFMGN